MVKVNGERGRLGCQAKMLLQVGKEIMVQHYRDSHQQQCINSLTLENAVNRGTLEMDSPRKVRYGQAAVVENSFNHLSDMDVLLYGHVLGFWT